jgi:hypothetical protein
LTDDYEVVWHGAKVDAYGTKGGLLGPYASISQWHAIEQKLRERVGCLTRRGKPSSDELPDALELVVSRLRR